MINQVEQPMSHAGALLYEFIKDSYDELRARSCAWVRYVTAPRSFNRIGCWNTKLVWFWFWLSKLKSRDSRVSQYRLKTYAQESAAWQSFLLVRKKFQPLHAEVSVQLLGVKAFKDSSIDSGLFSEYLRLVVVWLYNRSSNQLEQPSHQAGSQL